MSSFSLDLSSIHFDADKGSDPEIQLMIKTNVMLYPRRPHFPLRKFLEGITKE
jgi:hypothetical protein